MPETPYEPKETKALPASKLFEKRSSFESAVAMAGIGEILMDVFDGDRATMGGAPFNGAFHLNQLLESSEQGNAWVVSAVGDDLWGKQIRTTMAEASMSTRYLSTDHQHATGTSSVTEHDGQAGFIIQQDVAWDYLELSPMIQALESRCSAVVFGSLAQRSEESRNTIHKFVTGVDGHRLFDMNLRRNSEMGTAGYTGAPGYTTEIIEESLRLATIAKCNSDELIEIGGTLGLGADSSDPVLRLWQLMEALQRRYALQAVVITRGKEGAMLMAGDERIRLDDSQVRQDRVHPVGGGDAFTAGVLFGMSKHWSLEASATLANLLANYVVTQLSATPVFPKEVVDEFLSLMRQQSLQAPRSFDVAGKTETPHVRYQGRQAVRIEDDSLRLTAMIEGGHIAEILHKESGTNPLWQSPWPTIEPSAYSAETHPEFGGSAEARLTAGMLGHILCLDLFGTPGAEESAAGMTVHGEAPIAVYRAYTEENKLHMSTVLSLAEIKFERSIWLAGSGVVCFSETVESLAATDRPIAWTQHVTLGAPFLEAGVTQTLLTATKSKTPEVPFNQTLDTQKLNAEFHWPLCPQQDGSIEDLRTFTSKASSSGFTAHLMDPRQEHACFAAWSPRLKLLFGYIWKRTDFPWLARWEENHLRPWAPWNLNGFALGMEFGVSPLLESRRDMVERGTLFGTPTYRWLPAKSSLRVKYCAFTKPADLMPARVVWDGNETVTVHDE